MRVDGAKWATVSALAVVVAWDLLAPLAYLGNYPPIDWPQMGIAAPAYQLASVGVYGGTIDMHRCHEPREP